MHLPLLHVVWLVLHQALINPCFKLCSWHLGTLCTKHLALYNGLPVLVCYVHSVTPWSRQFVTRCCKHL